MTPVELFADWISDGALTRARQEAKIFSEVVVGLDDRLSRIASLETPKANATVKRMARIARGEE